MRRSHLSLLYTVLVVLLHGNHPLYVRAQTNSCKSQLTCGVCIQHAPDCTWCNQKDYKLRETPLERCDLLANHRQQNCTTITNPTSEFMPTKDDDWTNTTKVKPQQATLALRPGQQATFSISVRTPENYPVDLYMLMDMSYSMRDNLEAVRGLGKDLADKMDNITSRFRVGFGTMVDKPVAPFLELNENHFQKPVRGYNITSPWVYRNALPLTQNKDLFEASVDSQGLSESIDDPDGWLDALMQVAVCDKHVGWSPKDDARRVVVVSTEEQFHIAGDGLLGGIATPNDGRCKLGNGNEYLGTTMDFPSLGHLRKVLSETSIVPIFAVPSSSYELYEKVKEYFGSEVGADVGQLSDNSTNIVSLIREIYEKIGRTQTIYHNADDIPDVEVNYFSDCVNGKKDGQSCTDVPVGKTVTFNVSVTLKKCPSPKKEFAEFSITTALGDKIPIKVKYLCECDCYNKTVYNSSKCSGNGRFECGKCYCNDGFVGERCDCDESNKQKNNDACKARANDTKVCSGAGECQCGKCVCEKSKFEGERIDGKYCQCSSLRCSKDENGKTCGGDHGKCDCGKCQCNPGWSGPSCSCANQTRGCYKDGDNLMCSGRGRCECEQCICNNPYTGKYCETCDGCRKGCAYYKDCVRCKIYQTGPLVDNCDVRCNATIKTVDDVESHGAKGDKCVEIDDEDDCTFAFVLHEEDEKVEIFAELEKRCPREEGYLLIIIGVILGIVAIGAALLLIWKLLATIQDRREFAKFEQEQQNARWDTSENPIFKQATTTFQNPTYGGKG